MRSAGLLLGLENACWTRSVTRTSQPPGVVSGGRALVSRAVVRWPRWRRIGAGSVSRLNLAPEGVDAGVPLVGDLLEGLVGLPGLDVEARVRDSRGDRSTKARWQDGVEFAGQDEGRGGDLRQAVSGVVGEAHLDLGLKGLDGLLVGGRRGHPRR